MLPAPVPPGRPVATSEPVPVPNEPPVDRTQATAVERTKNGLLLLVFAVLLLWIPVAQYLGLLLGGIGAILMILGARPFGPRHGALVYGSVFAFVTGYAVEFALAAGFVSTVMNLGSGATGPAAASVFLSAWDGLAAGTLVVDAFLAMSYVLIAFGVEDTLGRVVLLTAAVLQIVLSGYLIVFVIDPLLQKAVNEAFASNPVDTTVLANADAQLQSISGLKILSAVPALLFAVGYAWAYRRIQRGGAGLPSRPAASRPPT